MTTKVVVVKNDVQRRLNQLVKLTTNSRPLMVAIAATLHEETIENFDTEGHGSWPALKHRDGKPLQDTRRLLSSITQQATPNSAALATNVIYAALHQFGALQGAFGTTSKGAPIPWGDVPAREYFPIDKNGNITISALQRVIEVLDEAAQKALK